MLSAEYEHKLFQGSIVTILLLRIFGKDKNVFCFHRRNNPFYPNAITTVLMVTSSHWNAFRIFGPFVSGTTTHWQISLTKGQ